MKFYKGLRQQYVEEKLGKLKEVESKVGVRKIFRYDSTNGQAVWDGELAQKAFEITKNLHVGDWVDQLLEKFPKNEMVKDPEVLGLDQEVREEDKPSFILLYRYEDFTLLIARGYHRFPRLNVYAIQVVFFHDEELKENQEELYEKWDWVVEKGIGAS